MDKAESESNRPKGTFQALPVALPSAIPVSGPPGSSSQAPGRSWAQIPGALSASAVDVHETISPCVPQFPPNKEPPLQA